MFSSKNKLTEDQLREGILSKILLAIVSKRVGKVEKALKDNPRLAKAVRNADKAVKELDKTLKSSGKLRGVKFKGTRKGW